MWGQDHFIRRCSADAGIIPTRVGTRRNHTLKNCQRQDHPHACGDKVALGSQTLLQEGSSPRVWGQVYNADSTRHCLGIIPTRVGTSSAPYSTTTAAPDHPHACGDKEKTEKSLFCGTGSSPRVWGQGIIGIIGCEHTGIIPTRVGTSCRRLSRTCLRADHPHACGDKCLLRRMMVYFPGSSPRVWGQV